MIVAGLQIDIVWEDRQANFERIAPQIRAAAQAGAQLVVLPEMFACGFSLQAAFAEPPDGPSTQFLRDEARAHGIWLAGSIPERVGDRPTNTLVLVAPDGIVHRYRKIHPFTFAGEHHHYAAGSEFVTVDVYGVRCTLFICYDLRFADEFWATALRTDCYLVVANWPDRRRMHWSTLLRARAIENQAYVVGINRVGQGGGLEYTGDSAIHDPWGETLASAAGQPTILLANIDPKVVTQARERFPVLPDRRSPSAIVPPTTR